MPREKRIALCLSGGGFRAALFHLGVLKRLHELGLLWHVKLLSAVSGGAVTAALFHNDWQSFETRLLEAARIGILGAYNRSIGIWISIIFALFFVFVPFGYFLQASIVMLLIAMILYLSLLPQAREYERKQEYGRKSASAWGLEGFYIFSPLLPSRIRALVLPLSPSMMRVTTLDRLLDHKECGEALETHVYLGTVELGRGKEMVFSRGVLTELGLFGSRNLWEQTFYQGNGDHSSSPVDIHHLPVSIAVAASSAFPPFFRPIAIRRANHKLIGVFSDGGVADNAALHPLLDMMIYCSQKWSRYAGQCHDRTGKRIGPLSFEEYISDIFVINAGAPPSQGWGRWSWFDIFTLRRIVDIMQSTQEVNMIQKLRLASFQNEPECAVIQIDDSEFPLENGLRDTEIPKKIARIRTHFDAFDAVETATLIYSGYCQADIAFSTKAEVVAPLQSFHEIARAVTGADTVGNMSKDEIIRHLRYSHLRLSYTRKICRTVALMLKRLKSICGD